MVHFKETGDYRVFTFFYELLVYSQINVINQLLRR